MKLFLDTANVEDIKKAWDYGLIEGVTTNPSLIAQSGRDVMEVIAEIAEIVDGPISAEVSANHVLAQDMIDEGIVLSSLHKNIVVKIPMTLEGLKATKALTKLGIKTNVTLIFSLNQALLAANAGATYVSPFVGRVEDISLDGVDLVRKIAETFKYFNIQSEIISASIRSVAHVSQSAQAGAHIATLPLDVIEKMTLHPLTSEGIEKFKKDYNAVFKQ